MLAFFLFPLWAEALDLEEGIQDFVLETRKIEIPGHPYAFNPSIVLWRGSYLLCCRELTSATSLPSCGYSHIIMTFLNDDFSLDGAPYILDLQGEDARLVNVDERLYIVCDGGFRVLIGELDFDGDQFLVKRKELLINFPQENPLRREKNWVPFDYQGDLHLAYSLEPHEILLPSWEQSGSCEQLTASLSDIDWSWGELRGGTPAIRYGNEYLAFFHSSINLSTIHSEGHNIPHYFMGAYTFQKDPPFAITRMSQEPLIGPSFYHGLTYPPYWHPVQVVFPCGLLLDDDVIWVTYGRQDHEMWIVKLDKEKLLQSLISTSDRQGVLSL